MLLCDIRVPDPGSRHIFDTAPYGFGETRVATLTLLIFTVLSG